MRVIGGTHRGRKLVAPKGLAVRPTSDRVREALFSTLGPIDGALVLDLFAGSGALSIEALSRGAERAVLVERARASQKAIEDNLTALGFGPRTEVLAETVADALRRLSKRKERYDLMFADPPYDQAADHLAAILDHAETLLAPGGRLIAEHATRTPSPEPPTGLLLIRARQYGETTLSFYERKEEAPLAKHNITLASRLAKVAPSATLALTQKAKELKAEGKDVVSLTAGEPDTQVAPHIIEAMKASLDRGETRYTAVNGVLELREAIRNRVRERDGTSYSTEQIIVSTGAKQALFNALLSLIDPGDEVVFAAPYWLSYRDMVHLADGTPVVIETRPEEGFVPSPEAIEAALSERTKAIILNSPSNPTGGTYQRGDFEKIAEVLRRHPKVIVLSDEIYRTFTYEPGADASLLGVAPDLEDRVVVIDGVSKSHAMTGLRIGWAAGPLPIIKAMGTIQGQSTSNPSATAQAGALAALTGDQTWVMQMVATFRERKQRLVSGLRAIEGIDCFDPRGAFYVFPSIAGLVGRKLPSGEVLIDGEHFARYLIDAEQLVVVPGGPFGAKNHIRLSYATDMATIEKGIERLARAVAALEA